MHSSQAPASCPPPVCGKSGVRVTARVTARGDVSITSNGTDIRGSAIKKRLRVTGLRSYGSQDKEYRGRWSAGLAVAVWLPQYCKPTLPQIEAAARVLEDRIGRFIRLSSYDPVGEFGLPGKAYLTGSINTTRPHTDYWYRIGDEICLECHFEYSEDSKFITRRVWWRTDGEFIKITHHGTTKIWSKTKSHDISNEQESRENSLEEMSAKRGAKRVIPRSQSSVLPPIAKQKTKATRKAAAVKRQRIRSQLKTDETKRNAPRRGLRIGDTKGANHPGVNFST
ncbi:hypothetical protein EVAR_35538_1 [Eumeta japonica]|uniref:Uncharacterized protein n=1 Tax=Eumeta variegata TaxID=151549 RepID=A0A4C1X8S8_EUMVA|nr:hypothetical protein EVAR_35538_1 [Eumeta japonica]